MHGTATKRHPAHWLTSVGLGLLAAACAPQTPPPQGAELFDEKCGACHGQEGRGPSMDELRALPSDRLRTGIRNHPTAGELLERLTAADIAELVEYLEE